MEEIKNDEMVTTSQKLIDMIHKMPPEVVEKVYFLLQGVAVGEKAAGAAALTPPAA
jgi:hypothetical protein